LPTLRFYLDQQDFHTGYTLELVFFGSPQQINECNSSNAQSEIGSETYMENNYNTAPLLFPLTLGWYLTSNSFVGVD